MAVYLALFPFSYSSSLEGLLELHKTEPNKQRASGGLHSLRLVEEFQKIIEPCSKVRVVTLDGKANVGLENDV